MVQYASNFAPTDRDAAVITYPLALGDQYTRVLEQGTGPKTIVLIHGLGARADRWRRNIGPLADAGYRCVAFDLPGHGFASKDGEFDFSVLGCARLVFELMTELDIERAVLVGTSLGGYIAAHIACSAPDRIEAMALVGTIGIVPMGLEARRTLGARFAGVTRDGIERKLRTVMFDDATEVTPQFVEEEWRINNGPGAHAAFARIAQYIAERIDDDVVGERLAALPDRPPTAIIWGRDDRAIPLSVGHAARDLLRPELYAEIPDAAHAPYFERAEAFNTLLLDFLSAH